MKALLAATAEHGGHVSGGGSYDLGSQVTLTAVPDSGYAFSYWKGATNSMQNPLTVTADLPRSYTAVFTPLPIALTSVVSDTNGVSLAWNNLAWAGIYRIFRGITSVPASATVLVELPNNGTCTYLDTTGDVDVEYWYWIEAEGPSDEVMSDPMTGHKEKPIIYSAITYTNLRGATNPNPATYREGTLVSFQNPGALTGYTFAGWTPSQITADMTGAQTVQASWTANGYSIAYNPNGGSGTMDATAMTYDSEGVVASNGFTYVGYRFTGWATNETGEVAYAAGQAVSNLTAQSGGVVTLYAVWEEVRWPITYTNLRGATNPNPATYREGTLVSFQNPGALTGYTFAGWTPSQITADMTGAQTVQASWTANGYSIAYNPNGGSGTMEATSATYDSESTIAANGFIWMGHVFTGWATNATGEVIYAAGQHVTNLTAQSSGVVTLYAVWDTLVVADPQIFPADGSEFTGNTCEVMILCATEGAAIYYSPNGTTPRLTDAYLYTGPFTIADTATIKAIAVLDGVRSEYVTATITKRILSLGEAVSADASGAALTWTTGGDAQWTAISDATTSSGYSAQSGTIGDATGVDFSATWLQTEVSGAGTVSFRWKVDCEWDDSGDMTWDRVAFYTNGVEAARMDGTSGWEDLSFTFADAGTHTLRWTFMKDDYNEETFPDHAWVSGFMWTPPPDPIPEISGDADVAGALAGSADSRLANHITTAAEYNAYRGWVNAKGLDHQTVKDSPRAWFSYAIGANGLVEKVFQNGDVTIDSLETESSGSFTFEVNVKDVLIGTGAKGVNLATVFEVQGSSSLSSNSFSRANVNVTLGGLDNGNLLVSATPKVECGTFFVRVRMYADEEKPRDDELTYVVVYNPGANGSGSQQTATKTHGGALTLKGATFTRDGYTQTGWATSDGGTKAYDLGASYTLNAAIALYPFWTVNTYTVTYSPGANGSGAQQTATKTYGVALALKGATFTRDGYTQTGWSMSDGGAKAYDLGASHTANAAVTLYPYWTADPHGKVQLWEGGPYWATTNIGAEEPWEYGYYFWWGDTVGYKRENDAWVTSDGVIDQNGFASYYWWRTYGRDTATLRSEGWITADGVLAPEHDAAHVQWGGTWRMPTQQELDDLCTKCDWTWTTTNGVNGYVVQGSGDYTSASIFLPAAGHGRWTSFDDAGSRGYYWSSVLEFDDSDDSWELYFYSGDHGTSGDYRFNGQSVRPVQGFTE